MQLYKVAKQLGLTNKEVIDRVRSFGVEVKNHMSNLSDETIETLMVSQDTEGEAVTEEPEEVWGESWDFKGPQHIPESKKDPSFTYGWVSYKIPGRVEAAESTGWQVDKEIKGKMRSAFDLPGRGPADPVEGAMIIGDSLLVRKPKGLAEKQYQADQSRVIEPEKAAKTQMKRKLVEMGIPADKVDDIVRGEVTSRTM